MESSAGSTPTGRAQVQTARFREPVSGGPFANPRFGDRGIASNENDNMRKTSADAANAQMETRSLPDGHDLLLTTLLCDLVEVQSRVNAAETLGVSYGALARAANTGRLTGRMRDVPTRRLLDGASEFDVEHRVHLADLERCVAGLEEDV